jgi:hypothetical protein
VCEEAKQKIQGLPEDREVRRGELGMSCKEKYIGNENFFECLEENPRTCQFAWFVGHFFLCRRPRQTPISPELKE